MSFGRQMLYIVFSGSPSTYVMNVLVFKSSFIHRKKEGLPLYITFIMNIFLNRHIMLNDTINFTLKGPWLMYVKFSL